MFCVQIKLIPSIYIFLEEFRLGVYIGRKHIIIITYSCGILEYYYIFFLLACYFVYQFADNMLCRFVGIVNSAGNKV